MIHECLFYKCQMLSMAGESTRVYTERTRVYTERMRRKKSARGCVHTHSCRRVKKERAGESERGSGYTRALCAVLTYGRSFNEIGPQQIARNKVFTLNILLVLIRDTCSIG